MTTLHAGPEAQHPQGAGWTPARPGKPGDVAHGGPRSGGPDQFSALGLAALGREQAIVSRLITSWIQLSRQSSGGGLPVEPSSFDLLAAVDASLRIGGQLPSEGVPSAAISDELERMLWLQFCRSSLRVRGGGGHPTRWNLSRAALAHLDVLSARLGEDWRTTWVPSELQAAYRRSERSEHDWDGAWGGP